ncbi:MAG: hypothetical protein NC412_09600 [Roseburia sp.]|nr:hypothetical protein [Roseburia sp.]MCM1279137.1 hypothetical protein [Robinsoniella sp.]
MPFNWNGDIIPSKANKQTDILGAKEIGGVGQLIYHPFRFASYEMVFDGTGTTVYPVCEPGKEPSFPNDDLLTGKGILLSLCNLAKVIDSYENKSPKEQLIVNWCLENMHPYSIDFTYSQLIENFDINSVAADFVREDATFQIEDFMKDLGVLYNAVRFYVALEGVLFGEDEVAYNLYEEGKYFEGYSYFEKYKHATVNIPDEIFKGGDFPEDVLADMQRESEYIKAHPVEQPSEGEFDYNHSPYDDYDELRQKLADFIPQFEMKLKLNSATGRYEFSADIQSVFDIAWYTLARMISEDPALEDRTNDESRPEGIMICCRNCGRFIIRKSNRQEFCDADECQKVRNARKQKAYRERKASAEAQKK